MRRPLSGASTSSATKDASAGRTQSRRPTHGGAKEPARKPAGAGEAPDAQPRLALSTGDPVSPRPSKVPGRLFRGLSMASTSGDLQHSAMTPRMSPPPPVAAGSSARGFGGASAAPPEPSSAAEAGQSLAHLTKPQTAPAQEATPRATSSQVSLRGRLRGGARIPPGRPLQAAVYKSD